MEWVSLRPGYVSVSGGGTVSSRETWATAGSLVTGSSGWGLPFFLPS